MKINKYKILFGIIILFYSLILSQFGFENFDSGYMSSFSWRIINGQDAYSDFIYKFPPVVIYFHALFMKILPETGQFFMFRILSYIFFALQVFFTVSGFNNIYDLKKYSIDKWAVMSFCYIVSIHNFISCPWPTTDGLLFFSVAFWLFSINAKQSFSYFFAIAFFCVLSALSKQSFYLVPLFFLTWILVKYDYKKTLLFFTQIVIILIIFFVLVYHYLSLDNFIKQTTGETTLHQLFYTGIHNYIYIPITLFLILLILSTVFIFGYKYFFKLKVQSLLSYLKWISITLFIISISTFFIHKIEIGSRIAFIACIIALLYVLLYKKKTISFVFPILILLAIAWSTSISWGYPFPILFATGIILSFIVLIKDELLIQPKYYFWICLPLCTAAFAYNIKPYRETNIFELKYSLESVSPKLKFIKTNKKNFEKHMELKLLISKYGQNYIVAPSLPLANYLFNNQSKLPGDWIINTEINRQFGLFIKLASNKKNYIFLEKSFLNHEECVGPKLNDFSSIGVYIYKNFNQIENTKYFIVYNSEKKK
ncbi:hypothetical protein BXU10_23720 [Flavobacterium sp. LM4]|nr:hypothetical protein BXU10_23720 [Flavobacterium sp. LM4]